MSPRHTGPHRIDGEHKVSHLLTFPGDGDESAVTQFWRQVQNRVFILARHWGQPRGYSRDDTEEIASMAMVRLMRSAPYAILTTQPVRWAYLALAVRSAAEEFANSRTKEKQALEQLAYVSRAARSSPQYEARHDLSRAIAAFSSSDRELLIGKLVCGKSIQELADERHSSYWATATHLCRLIAQLRQQLKS